jgi:hypothetical protein
MPRLWFYLQDSQVAEHYPQQTYSLVVASQNYRFYLQDSQVAEHYSQQTCSLVVTFQNNRFYQKDSQIAEHYPQQTYSLVDTFQNYRLYLQHSQVAKYNPQQTYSLAVTYLIQVLSAGFMVTEHYSEKSYIKVRGLEYHSKIILRKERFLSFILYNNCVLPWFFS